ncbi:hypothetical protein TURU_006022 [Turdus rufiventris]|nr:hypothetical protein TURU_006022 [Turdus rufiventris]
MISNLKPCWIPNNPNSQKLLDPPNPIPHVSNPKSWIPKSQILNGLKSQTLLDPKSQKLLDPQNPIPHGLKSQILDPKIPDPKPCCIPNPKNFWIPKIPDPKWAQIPNPGS